MAWSSFWQSYHSLPSYTWFEPILTPLWSFYLVWTISTNKLMLIFVLRDGLKFFLTIISFTAILHVVWVYFDTIMTLLYCLNNFNQQTHLNFCSKRWFDVQFDNYIIRCHFTRGLSPFFTPLWSSFLCWQSLKKSYQQTHHNFCSMIWLEVLVDNHIIHCHPTCFESTLWYLLREQYRLTILKFFTTLNFFFMY